MLTEQQRTIKVEGKADEVEIAQPDFISVIKFIYFSFHKVLTQKPGIILLSSMLLLMLWGFHGKFELLQKIWSDYRGPGQDIGNRPQLIQGIPWDHELISFLGGVLLVVIIPCLIIKFRFKEKLSDYGLGLPPKNRRSLAVYGFLLLMAVSLPAFAVATKDAGMYNTYPFYRPFSSIGQFLLYELCYLPFFIAIEFIFRGYLLFGLARSSSNNDTVQEDGFNDRYSFSRYAIIVPMLAYTAWHLGKPMPELFGTLFWGVAAGALIYACRSLWPVILAHWLLNVVLDGMNAGIIRF